MSSMGVGAAMGWRARRCVTGVGRSMSHAKLKNECSTSEVTGLARLFAQVRWNNCCESGFKGVVRRFPFLRQCRKASEYLTAEHNLINVTHVKHVNHAA